MRTTPYSIFPFIVSFILASLLWLYASLREEYATILDIPLEIRIPANRTSEITITPSVRVKVFGAGWQLVNLIWFTAPRCIIILPHQNSQFEDQTLFVTKTMMQQGIQIPSGIQVLAILQDTFPVHISSIAQKKVPVLPDVMVEPRNGFIHLNTTNITPDSIIIRSNAKRLSNIHFWKTALVSVSDIFESQVIQTTLYDTLRGIVEIPPAAVSLTLNVQQMAEYTFYDVPVQIISVPSQRPIHLLPERITVYVRGGIHNIAKLSPNDIRAFVDYSDILSNTTGTIRPTIIAPPETTVLQTHPRILTCINRLTNKQ